MSNETANTYAGWHETIYGSEWIDDVFCGRNLQPYYASVVETNGAARSQLAGCSVIQINSET